MYCQICHTVAFGSDPGLKTTRPEPEKTPTQIIKSVKSDEILNIEDISFHLRNRENKICLDVDGGVLKQFYILKLLHFHSSTFFLVKLP